MLCRRCDRQIPAESVICPFCGTHQGHLSSRRPSYWTQPSARTKRARGNWRSLLPVFAVILLAVIVISYLQSREKSDRFNAIQEAYQNGDTALLEILGTQYMTKYPDSAENEQIIGMIKDAMNLLTPEEYEALLEELREQRREQDEALRATARESILRLSACSPIGPAWNGAYGCWVSWSNRSGRRISEIVFYITGYDGGEPVKTASGGSAVAARDADTQPEQADWVTSQWLYVWDKPITRVELGSIKIVYDDGQELLLPADITKTLWE